MKKTIFFVIVILLLIGCKDKTSGDIKNKKAETTQDIVSQNKNKKLVPVEIKRDIVEDRKKAKTEIDNINTSNEVPFFLTTNLYVVDYLMSGTGAPDDVTKVGEWYKFEKNNNYSHGFFEDISETGKYKFENKILLLYPENEKLFPAEWRIMNSKDIIVMAGTSKFGNNSIQKHLQNVKEKPKKKSMQK